MSKMKAFAEKISVEMGYGGELTPPVLEEANRVLINHGLERHTFKIPQETPELNMDDLLVSSVIVPEYKP